MIKFAITGNIASGKSHVEKILKANGFLVFDADLISHDILINDNSVSEAFKDYDVFENGILSRFKLGKLIFADKYLRKKLEDIVHPLVREKILELFQQYKDESYVFVSIPLLFESGLVKYFDKILLISIDENIQLDRLMKRIIIQMKMLFPELMLNYLKI